MSLLAEISYIKLVFQASEDEEESRMLIITVRCDKSWQKKKGCEQ